MPRESGELRSVWAHALYCPEGRVSDFFRSPSACPQPRAWNGYRAEELAIQRMYIGDFTTHEIREIFAAAKVYVSRQCVNSVQERRRHRAFMRPGRMLEILSDVAGIGPAE